MKSIQTRPGPGGVGWWSCLALPVSGQPRLGVWTRPPALYSPWSELGVQRTITVPGIDREHTYRQEERGTYPQRLGVAFERGERLAAPPERLGEGGVDSDGLVRVL